MSEEPVNMMQSMEQHEHGLRFVDDEGRCIACSLAVQNEINARLTRELAEAKKRLDAIDEDRAGAAAVEQAWVEYCQRNKWDPTQHPSAHNFFAEGFISGWAVDKSFIGDDRESLQDTCATLRRELAEAREALALVDAFLDGEGTENAPERRCHQCAEPVRWGDEQSETVVCRSCLVGIVHRTAAVLGESWKATHT